MGDLYRFPVSCRWSVNTYMQWGVLNISTDHIVICSYDHDEKSSYYSITMDNLDEYRVFTGRLSSFEVLLPKFPYNAKIYNQKRKEKEDRKKTLAILFNRIDKLEKDITRLSDQVDEIHERIIADPTLLDP